MNDQVRWPTRCKRCFRDYKEHADDHDKARFGNLKDNDSGKANDPLTALRFLSFCPYYFVRLKLYLVQLID